MKKIFGIPIIGCNSTLCANTQTFGGGIHNVAKNKAEKTVPDDTPGDTTPS